MADTNNFLEIERKFLIHSNRIDLSLLPFSKIKQGYILRADTGSVRIRIEEKKIFDKLDNNTHYSTDSYLMIKKRVDEMSNQEITIPLEYEAALEMLEKNCYKPPIEKTRYICQINELKWEIDVFEGHRKGLILAEIEILSREQKIDLPDWIDKEVTGQPEYYNVNL